VKDDLNFIMENFRNSKFWALTFSAFSRAILGWLPNMMWSFMSTLTPIVLTQGHLVWINILLKIPMTFA